MSERWLLLTMLSEDAGGLPPNAAIGTTVEDQERADLNVPYLLHAAGRTLDGVIHDALPEVPR